MTFLKAGLCATVLCAAGMWPSNTVSYTSAPPPQQLEIVEKVPEPPSKWGSGEISYITAYSSEPEQTDDTPFITASGEHVRPGIIANNCLKFGTLVRIEGEIYEVQDRMNSRYDCTHFDIWFESTPDARAFGLQRLPVELIE